MAWIDIRGEGHSINNFELQVLVFIKFAYLRHDLVSKKGCLRSLSFSVSRKQYSFSVSVWHIQSVCFT